MKPSPTGKRFAGPILPGHLPRLAKRRARVRRFAWWFWHTVLFVGLSSALVWIAQR